MRRSHDRRPSPTLVEGFTLKNCLRVQLTLITFCGAGRFSAISRRRSSETGAASGERLLAAMGRVVSSSQLHRSAHGQLMGSGPGTWCSRTDSPSGLCYCRCADTTDMDYLERLLQQGVYLSLDRYPGRPPMPSWQERNRTLKALIDHGLVGEADGRARPTRPSRPDGVARRRSAHESVLATFNRGLARTAGIRRRRTYDPHGHPRCTTAIPRRAALNAA